MVFHGSLMDPKGMGFLRSRAPIRVGKTPVGRGAENVGQHFEVANDGDFLREHEVNMLKSS